MRVVFLGPPGAGKGTQAQRLKEHLGVAHLSTGEVLRDAGRAGTRLGKEAARNMQAGRLVPDDVVIGIVAERLVELGYRSVLHYAGGKEDWRAAGCRSRAAMRELSA